MPRICPSVPIPKFAMICGKLRSPLLGRTVHVEMAVMFAVGTAVTGRPPHRTARAEFPHAAPTLGV
jgi:hypothetical protein